MCRNRRIIASASNFLSDLSVRGKRLLNDLAGDLKDLLPHRSLKRLRYETELGHEGCNPRFR
jgi:hypothetical protein